MSKLFAHDPRCAGLTGKTLTKEWKGVSYSVTVLPDGFEHAGERFTSLSAVGKKITGSSTNGFAFFELGAAAPKSHIPSSADPSVPALASRVVRAETDHVAGAGAPAGAPVGIADAQNTVDGVAPRGARGGIVYRTAGARRRPTCQNCSCDHQAANPSRHGCCCGVPCSGPYAPEPVVHYALSDGKAACGAGKLTPATRSWRKASATCQKCLEGKD